MRTAAIGFSCVLLASCGSNRSADDLIPLPPRGTAIEGTAAAAAPDAAKGVFVSASGSDTDDGSPMRPFGSIAHAVAVAKSTQKRVVYACAGTYREALVIADGIAISGGFVCTKETWTVGDAASRIEAPSSPAMRAIGVVSATRVERLEIVAPEGDAHSASSIALLAVDAPGLTIAASRLLAGSGMAGADGALAIALTARGAIDGVAAYGEGRLCTSTTFAPCPSFPTRPPGAAGGSVACVGAAGHDGEAGGAGGSGGAYDVVAEPNSVMAWVPSSGRTENVAGPGVVRSGAHGIDGVDGASATTTGSMGENGYTASDGTAGTDGEPGHGGSGGDGLGPPLSPPTPHLGETWTARGGGGGGAGGCPGLAGGAGEGGGASIAALLVRSPMTFERTALVAHDGGAGGRGTFASVATPGGNFGSAALAYPGKPGGYGGRGGTSGNGAGGPSFAIAVNGATPRMSDATTEIGNGGAGIATRTVVDGVIAASASGLAEPVHAF